MCIKKGRDISLLFFGGGNREGISCSGAPHELLTEAVPSYRQALASVWMHVFCSYSCAVKRKIVPKATACFFLGYAQSGYRCYDVKSKR